MHPGFAESEVLMEGACDLSPFGWKKIHWKKNARLSKRGRSALRNY